MPDDHRGRLKGMAMRLAAAVVLSLAISVAGAQAAPAPGRAREPIEVEIIKPRPFSTKKTPPIPVAWRSDLAAAKDEAARAGRCVLVFFHADWSQPCRWMRDGTFASPVVAQTVNRRFLPVKVDDSQGTSPITKEYEVRVYPTVLFLDPGGKPLHMVLGPRPPDKFAPLLDQVAELPTLMVARKHKPNDLEANFALGNAFAMLNQLKRAAPYLERAAELAPKNENGRLSQARLILAVVPLEDGKSAEALENIEAYLKQFKQTPEVPVAIWYQGTILFQDGHLEEARAYFAKILRQFPTHRKAYEADKAIEAIDARLKAKKALEKKPSSPALPPAEPSPPTRPPAAPRAPKPVG